MNPKPFLSIVIPAYNEQSCIEASLDQIVRFAAGRSWALEIVVVDDGSSDETPQRVAGFKTNSDATVLLLRNSQNSGKGAAVKRGVEAAKGNLIAYMDADLSYDLSSLERATQLVDEDSADIVVGDRTHPESRNVRPYPWVRKLSGLAFSVLIQLLLFREVFDTQCGLKCCSSQTAHELFPRVTIPGFGFDVELLFIAAKRNKRIAKIPVTLKHSHDSKVRVIRDSFVMFTDLFRIRSNDHRGMYDTDR